MGQAVNMVTGYPQPNEVFFLARDLGKTGSKRLEMFSAHVDSAPKVGESFTHSGRVYEVAKVGKPGELMVDGGKHD